MPQSQLDHIVITAPSLAVGVDYVRQVLGVTPQMGGEHRREHQRMGTHCYLLKLGEKMYLEVISVNPKAPPPQRPRWFGLDHVGPDEPPRLATWVARTDDIEAAASASPIALGSLEPMTRNQLHWHITIPENGSLPCHGIAPTLIQWAPGAHPTDTLEDLGCSLVRLEGFHPDAEEVSAVLAAIGFDGEVSLRPLPPGARPYLVAHIRSPMGLCQLGHSPGRKA
jgi:hypothetical protein